MLHTAQTQDESLKESYADFDASTVVSPGLPTGQAWSAIRGRLGYSTLGALRTKPGRPDSPPSLSHSCSDKIAMWCRVGLQGALLSRVFEPVFLSSVTIGGFAQEQLDDASFVWAHAQECERAFWTRAGGASNLRRVRRT